MSECGNSLAYLWKDRKDYYSGCNMFVYYSQEQATQVLAELADPAHPKQAFRGPDMFVGPFIEANENSWLWSEQLGLWVGTWEGRNIQSR